MGFKIPIRYNPDGRLSGEAGSLAFYLGSRKDQGRWWIVRDMLCHKWNVWFEKEPQCLSVKRIGRKFQWSMQDGTTGTATLASHSGQLGTEHRMGLGIAQNFAAPQKLPDRNPQARKLPNTPANVLGEVRAAPGIGSRYDAATQIRYAVAGVNAGDVLNVRQHPDVRAPRVGALAAAARGIALAGQCSGGWCPVAYGDIAGWVHARFLTRQEVLGSSLGNPDAEEAAPRLVKPPTLISQGKRRE
jgi:hypothetical protein